MHEVLPSDALREGREAVRVPARPRVRGGVVTLDDAVEVRPDARAVTDGAAVPGEVRGAGSVPVDVGDGGPRVRVGVVHLRGGGGERVVDLAGVRDEVQAVVD